MIIQEALYYDIPSEWGTLLTTHMNVQRSIYLKQFFMDTAILALDTEDTSTLFCLVSIGSYIGQMHLMHVDRRRKL